MRRPTYLKEPKRVAIPLLLLLYASFGLYSVETDESAVGFVFGRAVAPDVRPGIHWNPPWPFGRVLIARTATNFTMPIGYRLMRQPDLPPISELWLTGDTNIVTARLNVQYRIRSLAEFKLSHEAPRELLRRAGERVVTALLVREKVDAVLTTRRHELPWAMQNGLQKLLDEERVGIEVESINIVELAPPAIRGGVRYAFQDVQNARADREQFMHEARAYRAQILAEAKGEADRLRSEGMAERHRRIEIARGETDRFSALAREHARAPRVTEQRLYLEALDRILPRIEIYVVKTTEGEKVNLRVVQ